MADKKGVFSMLGDITGAQAALIGGAMRGRRNGGARRRKRRTSKATKPGRKTRRSASTTRRKGSRKRARLVKGSLAAKRYMASIRKKRRK